MISIFLEWLAILWCRFRGKRRGHFMWCVEGVFWPLDPRPSEVRVADVARGLAHECRFAGMVRHFYSVAEHSVLVSIHAASLAVARGFSAADVRVAALLGMLHDASEAYVGDVIRPLKYERAMRGYRRAEARVQRAAELALLPVLVPDRVRALVSEVDSAILTDEITVLVYGANLDEERAKWGPGLGADVLALPPRSAERLWLDRWRALADLPIGAAAL